MTANVDERVQGLEAPAASVERLAEATPVVLATPHDISVGSVLIKSDAALPQSVRLDSKRYGAWKLVTGTDGGGFERTLLEAGWHLFFMVPEIRVSALSANRNQAIRAALRKALVAVEAQNFNAVEVV